MARAKKELPPPQRRFDNAKVGKILVLSDTFVYEVTVHKIIPGCSYNLEDSRYVSSKKYTKESSEIIWKEKVRFKRETTLIGAPENWLKENNYLEIKT